MLWWYPLLRIYQFGGFTIKSFYLLSSMSVSTQFFPNFLLLRVFGLLSSYLLLEGRRTYRPKRCGNNKKTIFQKPLMIKSPSFISEILTSFPQLFRMYAVAIFILVCVVFFGRLSAPLCRFLFMNNTRLYFLCWNCCFKFFEGTFILTSLTFTSSWKYKWISRTFHYSANISKSFLSFKPWEITGYVDQ